MTELLKLHVGCGKPFIPGFVHIDQVAFPHVDHVQDIGRLANFADNSASVIYACQVIEYFDREEVVGVLADWRRVLAPDGILRLSVPNFAVICKLYQSGIVLDKFLGTLYGRFPTVRTDLFITERRTTNCRCANFSAGSDLRKSVCGTGGRPSMLKSMTSHRPISRTWIRSTGYCSTSTCKGENKHPGSPSAAQATRTWVVGVGDDANPCSRTAPCKTWAGAISKTAAGGEIDALDPGGFDAVTITA